MRVSKSRNVCGYVKAVRRALVIKSRLDKAEERLSPLRSKLYRATWDANARFAKLTGGQIAEARRILAEPARLPAHAGQFGGVS